MAIEKPVRMRDIARLANVSVGTVSRVVNGQTGVGPATRRRVERIIDENGYQANPVARELSTGRSRTIGVLFPLQASEVVMHSTYPGLLAGLGDAAEARGYNLMLVSSTSSAAAERLRETIQRGRMDGVVLPAAGPRDRLLHEVVEAGLPTVLIGHRVQHPSIGWVDSAHDEAAGQLTELMLEGGRRKLVMLNGPASVSACTLRSRGFWNVVEAAPERVTWASEVRVAFDIDEARSAARSLLSGRWRPTAIVCGNDLIALGVLQAAAELRLRVPEDVAVTGFDDRTFAATTSPPLSTARMPLQRLGAEATEMLIAFVEERPIAQRHVVLPTDLVIRGTTPDGPAVVPAAAPSEQAVVARPSSGLEPVRTFGRVPAHLAR